MHLGLLAYAQAPSVSETELLEYYLISRGYYSGFVHVCFCERTTQGVNPQGVPELLWDPCNDGLQDFIHILSAFILLRRMLLTE